MLVLSEKFKTFLSLKSECDFLEGTTSAGKTTVGITKYMIMVAQSKKKFHIIAGADLGTAEKNIINAENGLLDQFPNVAEYYGNGDKNIKLPHIKYATSSGEKIIYVAGYDNKARWQKVLGGQVGCVLIDEVNIADMEFVREVSHRCEYLMTTSNPDDPNLPIYKEYINRSRPLKRYVNDYPKELLDELKEQPVSKWIHWYFSFKDNASMTEEDIEKKKRSVAVGTKMYKNKILGLRGKATGLVFVNFDRNKHVVSKDEAMFIDKERKIKRKFVYFSAGLDTAYSSNSPDTIAMMFIGITEDSHLYILDEKVYNNRDLDTPVAPSDTVTNFIAFLDRNQKEWGLARNVFVDSADQATIKELNKYKRMNACIYTFNNAYKKITIIDRINLQIGWLHNCYYHVVDTCKEHIKELETYSWLEDKDNTPEDRNDHTINSSQYAWIPYINKIGVDK